jgi:hypothetical protein
MKASLFYTARYMGPAPRDIWPLSGQTCPGLEAHRWAVADLLNGGWCRITPRSWMG